MAQATFFPTVDGFIASSHVTYANARSGSGATMGTEAGYMVVGQNTGFSVWQGHLRFDTSSLTAAALITAVSLQLTTFGAGAGASFTIEARPSTVGASLTTADYIPGASLSSLNLLASLLSTGFTVGVPQLLTSDANFLTAVNPAGFTEISLSSSLTRLNTTPANDSSLAIYTVGTGAGEASYPTLIVDYHYPRRPPVNRSFAVTRAAHY